MSPSLKGLSGADIDVFPAPHDVERLEPQPPVRRALAGFQIVLVAMPGADEMNFVGKLLAMPGAVGAKHILDLVHDDAIARRAALVHAEILVGVEFSLPAEHADLEPVMLDDAAIAVGQLGGFGDEDFPHLRASLLATAASMFWLAAKSYGYIRLKSMRDGEPECR